MKFQVIIKNIDEKMLGPVLASFPDGVDTEISRMQDVKRKTSAPLASKKEKLADMIATMPQQFPSGELAALIVESGHAAGSVTHFLRRARDMGLIQKVKGTAGNATLYEKIKR